MKTTKKILGVVAIIAIVILIVFRIISNKEKLNSELQSLAEFQNIVPVIVHEANNQLATKTITENGIFKSDSEVTIISETQGIALKVSAEIGQYVKAGQYLVSVEKSLLDKQLKLAQLNFENAEKDVTRFKNMLEGNAVTQKQYETVQLKYQSALTNLASLKKQIRNTQIKAPISGYITSRTINPGSLVAPGMPVFGISKQSQLVFTIKVSEYLIHSIKKGQQAIIKSDIYPEKEFIGKVKEIAVNTALSGRYTINIEISNKDNLLKPGMTGTATFQNTSNEAQIILPRKCIVGSILEAKVFVINNDTASLKPVVANRLSESEVVILKGVEVGDKVVSSGQINLEQGSKVNIINTKK